MRGRGVRLALKKTARPTLWGPVSHAIGKRLDHGPYSHCELVLDNGMSASSVMGEGVRLKKIQYRSAGAWDFFQLPFFLAPRAHKWFYEHVGERYDYGAMARFWWGVVHEENGRWTCTEAVGTALGWSRAFPYSPSALLARLQDTYAVKQVAGPWPDEGERSAPVLRRALGGAAPPLSDWGRP